MAGVLVALVMPVAAGTDTPKETLQWLPPPCDIPGLSQKQYRTCVEHLFCDSEALRELRIGKQMPSDPRLDEAYKQCLTDQRYRIWSDAIHWAIKP